jgi:hypothetical protein
LANASACFAEKAPLASTNRPASPIASRAAGVEERERGKNGLLKRDEFGRPKKKQRGTSLLYEEFGVRKQLLDDLYVRFFRLAEERIGEAAEHGIVSFISNSSYLTGRSHPIMRRSLLTNFHQVWIDNLNGDKFKTFRVAYRAKVPLTRARSRATWTPGASSLGQP